MMRKLLFFLMFASLATVATAQTNSRYYAENDKDNYFVGIGVGAQACLNPDNFDYGFGKSINPNFTISVGKLINPVWGVRLQVSFLTTTLFARNEENATVKYTPYKHKKYISGFVDALFNISNALGGYNPDRLFDLYGFAGPGLILSRAMIGTDHRQFKVLTTASLGLGGKFNVTKKLDINVEARTYVSQAPFGNTSAKIADGYASLTAGISYFWGGKNFVKVVNAELYNDANGNMEKYRELLSQEQASHKLTKEELEKERNKEPERIVEYKDVIVAGPRAIFFDIDKSKITSKDNVNISLAADIIKANPDVKYIVKGYADKATGSERYNQKLSEKRAKAVYDSLIKFGVSESQIEYQGFGGQPNMWDNSATLTRVVVIERAN